MSTAKRVAKNIFFKFSGEIIIRVLSLLFITYLIRTLSVSEYGRFNYALSFTTMFTFLIDLGVGVILMREVAKNKQDAPKYFGNILILKLISSIITYLLIIFSIHLLSHDKTTIFLTYIFGFWLIGQCLIEFQTAFFIAFEQLKFEAIVNTLTKILLAFFGIMVIFFGFGVIWVAVCYLVSITIANIISFVILYRKTIKPRFSLDIRFIRDTLLASVPIVLIALFTGIGDKVSTILLGNISGNYGVGLFGSVYKLYEAFFFLPGSIMVVFLPLFSQYYPQQMDNFKRLYRIVFKITISIALPVSGGIIMLSSQIIVLFFGQEYLPAARVLRFLFIAFIFVCMNSSLYYILISIGKQRLVLVGSAITFLINITLCLLLFPSYGYKSSGVIVAISTMILFCFNYIFVSKAIGTINILSLSYKQIISTLIMMTMLFFVPIENIFLRILLGGMSYIGSMILLKGVTTSEINYIKERIFTSS